MPRSACPREHAPRSDLFPVGESERVSFESPTHASARLSSRGRTRDVAREAVVRSGPEVGLALGCLLAFSGHADAQIALTNITQSSGLGSFVHTPNFLSVPSNYEWLMGGLAVGDFDGDGWPDLFVPKGGQGVDALFMNNGDGTFTNRAAVWGLASAHAGNGAAAADFDGDGDVDIFVTSYGTALTNVGQVGRNRLYRNEGGSFVDVADAMGVRFTGTAISSGDGAAWGDIDLDGDLDLVVAAWVAAAEGNRLFRNDGTAYTDLTGVEIEFGERHGFQPTIVDITGDGFPEILLSGDYGTSGAFVGQGGGAFVARESEFGLGIDSNAMGTCVADLDANGAPDWYVTSIFRDAPPGKGVFNGNALYLNEGGGSCVERSLERGCNDGGWGWGAVAVDLDHDGWEDLVEVNGVASGEWVGEQEYIFRNLGGATFERLGNETGLQLANDVRCVATLDFDRDGDLDLALLVNRVGLRLYRNDAPPGNSWIELDLIGGAGTACAPHGYGALVEIEAGGRVLRRWVHGGSGFRSSNEPVVHFGLGDVDLIDRLIVRWPNGQDAEWTAVPVRQRLVLEAPARCDLDGDGSVGMADLMLVVERWGAIDRSDRTARIADLDADGTVGPRDLAELLDHWATPPRG